MKKSLGAKTIVFPTPAFIVATYNKAGKANVMTAAWAGICCSTPPCVGVSLREATYTHGNILQRRAFTLNIASEQFVKQVDYFGIVSGEKIDKLAEAGFTPVKSELVDAPYIDEFPFILECALFRTFELGTHTQFIGEIKDIKVDESVLKEDDIPDIEKIRPIIFSPGDRCYYGVGTFLGKGFSIGREMRKR
jgi:flavin reductase (DIM6/NTAB) family NADH-FMN oxidoreductase RutF